MSVEILLMSCMSVWRFRDELCVCVFSCMALHCIASHCAGCIWSYISKRGATDKRG